MNAERYTFLQPYFERLDFRVTGPKSNLPLIHLYLTPGKSRVLPPRTITTP